MHKHGNMGQGMSCRQLRYLERMLPQVDSKPRLMSLGLDFRFRLLGQDFCEGSMFQFKKRSTDKLNKTSIEFSDGTVDDTSSLPQRKP